MFSYTMLATSPLFCYTDWPRRFFARFPAFLSAVLPLTSTDIQPSTSCVYNEIHSTSTERQETPPVAQAPKLRFKHKLGAIFTIVYIIEQLFMPYSHFITQVHLPITYFLMLETQKFCYSYLDPKKLSANFCAILFCFYTNKFCLTRLHFAFN